MRGRQLARTALAISMATAATLALAACGGSDADEGPSDEPVTLRFTWWGGDDRQKRTQQVIDLFQKKHQNITIRGEFKEWTGYWDSLATTVAAKEAPDIIQMDELYIASYAERGALLDLESTKEYLDTSGIDTKALDTGVVDGKQYGVPAGLTAYAMVANADLLAQYKIPMPDDATWTWDDLKRIGADISKASGGKVTGVQSWGFDAGGVNIWARQAGGSLYDDEGKVAVKPEVLAGFFAYLADLAKAGAAPAPSVTVERAKAGLAQSGTATNTSVFGTWWNTQLTALSAASGANLKLLRLPGEAQASSPGPWYKPSMYWSIASTTEHRAEAGMFLDFLVNDPEAANILQTERGVPANQKVQAGLQSKLSPTDKAAVDYLNSLKVGETPRVTPKGASDIEKILARHTEDVLFGRVAPDAAAKAFISELQQEIDSA
jgi:multiple sugar transport system substrate-binding protein